MAGAPPPAPPIYLDHNATAPLQPAAKAAMLAALATVGNASSVHRFGRAARRLIEDARDSVAALVGVAAEQVVFTASGTEANNHALRGFPGRPVITSAIEHESVLAATSQASRVPVDRDGVIELAALDRLLEAQPGALVSVMLANNETGVIQPVAAAAALTHRAGGLLHCDASQAPGRIACDMAALNADLMTLSGHKIGGPFGAAALIVRAALDLAPLLVGGGQELRRRAGTENVAAIAGFGAAAAAALGFDPAPIARLRDRLEAELIACSPELAIPGVAIPGRAAPRLPNTATLIMPAVAAQTQVIAFDLAGIAVSAGSACSSGKITRSHVLDAMGVPPEEASCAIRVSLGVGTTAAEIDRFVAVWRSIAGRRGRRAA